MWVATQRLANLLRAHVVPAEVRVGEQDNDVELCDLLSGRARRVELRPRSGDSDPARAARVVSMTELEDGELLVLQASGAMRVLACARRSPRPPPRCP